MKIIIIINYNHYNIITIIDLEYDEINNVYNRKEKYSSGERTKILDPTHLDGNVAYIVRAIIEDKTVKDGFVMIQVKTL